MTVCCQYSTSPRCVQAAENTAVAQQQQLSEKSTQLIGVKQELRDFQQAQESTMKVALPRFYAAVAAFHCLCLTVQCCGFTHASMLYRHT